MPSILSATSNTIVLTTDTIISKEMVFPTFLLFDLHFSSVFLFNQLTILFSVS